MTDITHLNFPKEPRKSEKRAARNGRSSTPKKPSLKDRIPVLPSLGVNPEDLQKPDQRSVACVNLRLAGAPFVEIAKELGYASSQAAKSAYVAALANMFPVEDAATLRQAEAMRAEQLLRRSLAMASADYFVDADDPNVRIPNTDRLRWHEQAAKDLALHAMITGAKAPTRVEVSADTQELNQIVDAILQGSGEMPELEASTFDVDEIPAGPEGEIGDEPSPMGS